MKLADFTKPFSNKKIALLPTAGLLVVLLLAVGYSQYTANRKKTAQPSEETGLSQELVSDLEKAEVPADTDPASAAAHYQLIAGHYFDKKQYSKAAEYYEKALVSTPTDSTLLEQAGDTYKALGNDTKAKEYYGRAIEATKAIDEPGNNLTLAGLYEKSGNKSEAIKYYQAAIAEIESNQPLSEEDEQIVAELKNKIKELEAAR